jgi:hypothetical protein
MLSPFYGGSGGARTAGAADGPGVRRSHGAVRRRLRRGSRHLGGRASGRVGPRAAHASDDARPQTARGGADAEDLSVF